MKKIVLLCFLCTFIWANKVDEATYSLDNLSKVKTQIQADINDKKADKPLLKEELSYVQRIEELKSQTISFTKLTQEQFANKTLSVEFIYNAFHNISDIELKVDLQNELLERTQDKLSVLRKNIENIVEENKKSMQLYQLQFLYYKTQKNYITNNITTYTDYIKNIQELIKNNINKIKTINVAGLNDEIERFNKQIQTIQQTVLEKEIELEKEYVLGESSRTRELSKRIYMLNNQINGIIENIIVLQLQKTIYALGTHQKNDYITFFNQLTKRIAKLKLEKKEFYIVFAEFINETAKKQFGNTQMILTTSLNQTKNLFNEIFDVMATTLFVFNEKSITFLSLLKALALIILGFTLGIFYKRWLHQLSHKWPNMSQMSLKLSANIGFYVIVLITIMIAMSSLGIDMSSISLIAGALSIGIGFGLQTVVSNFISGIILMFERTIRIGDIIEINELLKGTVTDMRIRSTTIKTFDNIDIVVPNSSFIQNNVINWTLEDTSRRLHVPFGVAYGTSVALVKEVIVKELFASDLKFIRYDEDKQPEIRLENMNSSSVDFELLVWIRANDKLQPNSLKSDFMILIYNTLYKYNIEIPFPQLDLHIKKEIKKLNETEE